MKSKTFATFKLYNDHATGSKPLSALTEEEYKRAAIWEDKDKLLYTTPEIKLRSIIEGSDVTLNKRYAEQHPMNAERLFEKPHIELIEQP